MKESKPVRAALVGLVAVGALAASTAGASASDASIKAVVVAFNPTITSDEGRVLTAVGTFEQTGNSGPARLAIAAEVRDLNRFRSALGAQRASSTRGRAGKARLIRGVGLIVRSYRKLSKAFAENKTKPGAARADAKKAVAEAKRGRAQLVAGVRLLS